MTDAAATDDLVADFVAEARELIQAAAEDLLALDGPADPAVLNRVFRAVHTLKGSVALFDWPEMLAALHAAEDGLAAARTGRIPTGPGLVDASLAALDATARWTEAIAATGSAPAGAAAESARLVESFRSLLAPAAGRPDGGASGPAPDWAAGLLAGLPEPPDGPVTALRYVPRPDCFFAGDDPIGLLRRLPGLLALARRPGRRRRPSTSSPATSR